MRIALYKADDPTDPAQGWMKLDVEVKTINEFIEKFAVISGTYVYAEVYETTTSDSKELVDLIEYYLEKNYPRAPRAIIGALFDSAKKVIDAAGIKITVKVEDTSSTAKGNVKN